MALCQLVTETKGLSSIAHDGYLSSDALCMVLWTSIDGQKWALHVQSKQGIEDPFSSPRVLDIHPL